MYFAHIFLGFMDKIAPFHRDLKDPKTLKGWERKLRKDALDVDRVPDRCPFCSQVFMGLDGYNL
jgi:hypothetical protein